MFAHYVKSLAILLGVGVFGSLMSACNPQIALTIRTNEGGTVSVSPQAGACTTPPSPSVDIDGVTYQQTCYGYQTVTNVTLAATPEAGYVFTGWSGNCEGLDACQVYMSRARTVTARFRRLSDPIPLSFQASDAELDAVRNQLFVVDKAGKKLHVIDNVTGNELNTLSFAQMPERLFLDAASNTLFVTLLTQEHSAVWWDEDQTGTIAMIDINSLLEVGRLHIDIDPFDLVVAGDKLVVSSGSGQWTSIKMYSVASGDLMSTGFIRQQSLLSLHPNQQWVYAADTDTSPSDIEKFDIATADIIGLGDSPYHGDHRMGGNVFLLDENTLLTRGGDIFKSAADAQDMSFIQSMPFTNVADTDQPAFSAFYFVVATLDSQFQIAHINKTSQQLVGSTVLPEQGQFLFAEESQITVLTTNGTNSTVRYLAIPCPDCATNVAPMADFTVSPATGGNVNTSFLFDAAASTDADNDDLTVRWDFDSNGTFETEFSADRQISHSFNIAGTKNVTLQVKDSAGNVASKAIGINVATAADDGQPGTPHTAYELQFVVADAAVDSISNKLYVTEQSQKRLYVVNLGTGLVERFFQFANTPESLTITPDSSRLYVALLTGPHSYYRWEHDGFIAEFDLASATKTKEFHIGIDPYDLVATNAGKLVVSSGSAQWTYIHAYDTTTDLLLGSAGIRQMSHIALHPNQQWVYAVDTDSSPRDVEKFDISGAGITARYDSPYHGTYPMGPYIFMAPAGNLLMTSSGSLFATAAAQSSDLVYAGQFAAANDVAFSPAGDTVYLQGSTSQQKYAWPSRTLLQTSTIGGRYIFVSDNQVVSLNSGTSNTVITKHSM